MWSLILPYSRSRCRCCCLWPFCFLDLEHYSDPVRPAAITPRGVGYVVVSLFAWRRPAHRSCDIANDPTQCGADQRPFCGAPVSSPLTERFFEPAETSCPVTGDRHSGGTTRIRSFLPSSFRPLPLPCSSFRRAAKPQCHTASMQLYLLPINGGPCEICPE